MPFTTNACNARYAAGFAQPLPGWGAGVTPEHLFVMPHAEPPRRRSVLLKPDPDTLPRADAVPAGQALGKFLQGDALVLCLTGPAGCGKTTLAQWLCHGVQAGDAAALALLGGRALWVVDVSGQPGPAGVLPAPEGDLPGGVLWLDGCGADPAWGAWAEKAACAGLRVILAGRALSAPAGACQLALAPLDDAQRGQWVDHFTARCGQELSAGLAACMWQAHQLPTPRMTGLYYLPGGLLRLAQIGGDGGLCGNDWALFPLALGHAPAARRLGGALALRRLQTGEATPSPACLQALLQECEAGAVLPDTGLTEGRFANDEIYGYYLADALCSRLDAAARQPGTQGLSRLFCQLLSSRPLPPAALYFLYQRACDGARRGVQDFASGELTCPRVGDALSGVSCCLCDPALFPAEGPSPVARLRTLLANVTALYRVSLEPWLAQGDTIRWQGSNPGQNPLLELFAGVFRKDTLSALLGFGLGSQGDFSGVCLADESLNLASFAGADFTGADLSGVIMTDALLARANLTGARLYGANLTDSVLADARLAGADLRMGNIRGINFLRADLTGAQMWSCDLDGSFLVYADLTGADLTDADCKNTHFEKAKLTRARLDGVHMAGVSLLCADLRGASLRGAHLAGANLSEADLSGADLTGADLTGANLTGCNLTDCDLSAACTTGAIFA